MIVYRAHKRSAVPVDWVAGIRESVARLDRASAVSHDAIVELLIDFGELESGVADALSPEWDEEGPVLRAFRETACLFGSVLVKSWLQRDVRGALARVRQGVDSLARFHLPHTVEVSVPEGYAYYALYPETYLEAATRFVREQHPRNAVVIGIRSIGTSLGAAVAAAVEATGCPVETLTVRPRGHPFERRLALSPTLAETLRRLSTGHFLVVDEGPGLSGSSFAAATEALSALGIADERILLFPSWEPDGEAFVSPAARARWRRHRKYTGSFENAWRAPAGSLDLSAGGWRSLLCGGCHETPAVQPQHERRKYLDASAGVLYKFAGLGRYGRAKLERAEELADAGFAPAPLGLKAGFLATRFIDGRPACAADAGVPLLDRMARYLAFLARRFPRAAVVPFDDLIAMMRVNAGEGLGPDWSGALDRLESLGSTIRDAPAIALDGRMLPHEWLATRGGYVKTDALDHHDDHFYPGCQDMAWDIAGACVEFDLDAAAREYLTGRYVSLSGDAGLPQRLPFYTAAYLAFRLGYATLAANTLPPSTDREAFRALVTRYSGLLRAVLNPGMPGLKNT